MAETGYVITKNIHKADLFKNNQLPLKHLDIELTERCNNACIHCYINLPEKNKNALNRELSTDQWKAILQQAADIGVLSVRITGGEPLLREDFSEIYLHARRLGMKVLIFTNARLISPELSDLLVNIPPLKKIEISVYGMQSESYDTTACSPGAFVEFRRGVNYLIEQNIPFVIKSVLLPPNKNDIEEIDAWAASIPGMIEPAYTITLDLRTRRDSPTKNRIIRKMRLTPQECVDFIAQTEETYRCNMAQFSKNFLCPQGNKLFTCGAGETGCVDAYGHYQMCMLLRHPDFVYNLNTGSLHEAHTKVFPLFREIQATNPVYLQRCARCFLKGLCLQCPAKSWTEHGTLDTPVDYLCQVAHAQARFLGLLKPGEHSWEVRNWQERIEQLVQKEDAKRTIEQP